MKRMLTLFLVVSSLAIISPKYSEAQDSESICVHFVGMGMKRRIELRSEGYSLSGTLPVTLCELRPDETYILRTGGVGLESRMGKFSVSGTGATNIDGMVSSVLLRNLLLPGWGSRYSGRGSEALVDALGFYSSLYKFLEEEKQYHHIHNRYDVLNQMYAEAADVDRAKDIRYRIHRASLELNVQNKSRIRFAILSGGVYLEQLFSSLILSLPPSVEIGSEGQLVRFKGGEKSRVKAVFLSVIHPGRGQFYEGKVKRGILFSFLTSISAITALDYHSQYDWAEYRYETAVENFNNAQSIDEKEELMDQADKLWEDLQSARKRRNYAYSILAVTWGLNVIDSFFMPENSAAESFPISYEINGKGAFMVFRF